VTSIGLRDGRRAAGDLHGAGAEMRRAIGVAVFYGMLGVTLFGLALTPLFYVLFRRLAQRFERRPPLTAGPSGAAGATARGYEAPHDDRSRG